MKLHDAQSAWQALDQRLQRQETLQLQLLTDRRLTGVRKSLRPLFWGQMLQMVLGMCFIVLAALLWSTRPHLAHLIAAGVLVHAYGVACIVMAGTTLGGITRVDYARPVLEIQKRLAGLRARYVRSGMVASLPWWFLWVPILMVLSGLGGVDLYARAPSVVWIGMAIGIAGLLATAWFHRWSRSPKRPRLAQAMQDSVTGGSLCRAQRLLDEIAAFQREEESASG